MKKILLSCCILFAATTTQAQNINFINNTSCNVFADFYCRTPACGVGVSTSGAVIGPGTTTFDATTLNGNVPLPAGSAWSYGMIGDVPSACRPVPAGSGCNRNFNSSISDNSCVPGVTSLCFNADTTPTCNTCTNTQINVTATFQTNGDLDIVIN